MNALFGGPRGSLAGLRTRIWAPRYSAIAIPRQFLGFDAACYKFALLCRRRIIVRKAVAAIAASRKAGQQATSPVTMSGAQCCQKMRDAGSDVVMARAAITTSRERLKRVQEVDEIGLLLVGEADREPLIVEVHDVEQRGGPAVVEKGRA